MLQSTSALEQDREAPSTLRIGQLARLASVQVETLRYYEREGLLDKPYQSLRGYRAYPVSAVVRVSASEPPPSRRWASLSTVSDGGLARWDHLGKPRS